MGKIIAVLIVLVLMVGCGSYESKMQSIGSDMEKIIQDDPRELTKDEAVEKAGEVQKLYDKALNLTPPENYKSEHRATESMLYSFTQVYANIAIANVVEGLDEKTKAWKVVDRNAESGLNSYERAKKLLNGED